MGEQYRINRRKPGKAVAIAVSTLAIISMLCLFLVPFFEFVYYFIIRSYYFENDFLKYYWEFFLETDLYAFRTAAQWSVCGLILPTCMLLMLHRPKRRGLAVFFLIVAVLFLSVQSVSCVLRLVELPEIKFIDYLCDVSTYIPGGNLLYGLFYGATDIMGIFFTIAGFMIDSSYILPNLLCTIGFFIIAVSKNVRTGVSWKTP